VLALFGAGPARGDATDWLAIWGLQDVAYHNTDSGSRLLSQNGGDPMGAGDLRLSAAAELPAGLQVIATGRLQGTTEEDERETDGSLEQAVLRWIAPGRAGLIVDAGKIVMPFGNFSRRYLSDVNPLIGQPDSYSVSYPVGLVVTGRVSRLDYRVAVFDEPLSNPDYVPPADEALRPGAGLGITPLTGLRLGSYYTRGPYLGRSSQPMIPGASSWKDFDQEVVGFELEFSRGYFELNGDIAFSSYEVPTVTGVARGQAWFVEPKYTWTPRLFTAVRVERNDYPFIRGVDDTFWIAGNAAFRAAEVGGGWRFTANLLLKASYRWDNWAPNPNVELPDGRALALQLSYGFDVSSWLRGPR
jgi:hypothetical protein